MPRDRERAHRPYAPHRTLRPDLARLRGRTHAQTHRIHHAHAHARPRARRQRSGGGSRQRQSHLSATQAPLPRGGRRHNPHVHRAPLRRRPPSRGTQRGGGRGRHAQHLRQCGAEDCPGLVKNVGHVGARGVFRGQDDTPQRPGVVPDSSEGNRASRTVQGSKTSGATHQTSTGLTQDLVPRAATGALRGQESANEAPREGTQTAYCRHGSHPA